MSDVALRIRHSAPLNDPKSLCAALGLGVERSDRQHQARGLTVRCPVHGGLSCSVTDAGDGTVRVKCFGCEFTGDALSLVAAARGLSTRNDFAAVLRDGAELAGLWEIVDELDKGERRDRPAFVPPTKAKEPERDYPPIAEVRALLDRCDPPSLDPEVSRWLLDECAIDPDAADGSGAAFALRMDRIDLPSWAKFGGQSWCVSGHRLIFPMVDAFGELRSVRAGRVTEGDSPKRVPPGGFKASGLVLACPIALAMMRGTYLPRLVVVSEGETDALEWMTKRDIDVMARIGIVNGSWTEDLANKIPDGAIVAIRTDNDLAGDKYAAMISDSVKHRCDVRRKKR